MFRPIRWVGRVGGAILVVVERREVGVEEGEKGRATGSCWLPPGYGITMKKISQTPE